MDINETMKTLDSIDSELNRLIEKNNSDIREMSSFDADSLKKQMESDLDVKLDVPETVTVGKASKDVFDKIKKEMKDEIISQDGYLNMRTGAGASKSLVRKIPAGAEVRCYGYYNKDSNGKVWLYVAYGKYKGYIHSGYLKAVK